MFCGAQYKMKLQVQKAEKKYQLNMLKYKDISLIPWSLIQTIIVWFLLLLLFAI